MRLAYSLYAFNGKLTGFEVLRRIRIKNGFGLLSDYLRQRLIRLGWNDFSTKLRNKKLLSFIKLIFGNFEKRKEIIMKSYGINNWFDKIKNIRRKEKATSILFNIINIRNAIISAETLGSAFIIIKLFDLIRKIQLKSLFDKLNQKKKNCILLEDISSVFIKCNDKLLEDSKKNLTEKLYKLYVYKLLEKLVNSFENYFNKNVKDTQFKDFFYNLKQIYISKSEFTENFSKELNKKHEDRVKFNFTKKTKNPKKVQSKNIQRSPYKYVVPHMVNRLNKLMNDNIKFILFIIKSHVFTKELEKYSKKKVLNPFIYNLRTYYDYLLSIPNNKSCLKTLFRKYFFKQLGNGMIPIVRVIKIAYLLKITFMNSDLAKKHFLREIIRKWKFISFMKRVAKKKMETMYKAMHLNYISMANEVFGDEDNGIIKEFEVFGNSIGMFTNEDLETYEDMKKKFYKGVKKRYMFEATEVFTDEEYYSSYNKMKKK